MDAMLDLKIMTGEDGAYCTFTSTPLLLRSFEVVFPHAAWNDTAQTWWIDGSHAGRRLLAWKVSAEMGASMLADA